MQQLLHPYVNDFLEIACDDSGNHLVLERVMIPKESVLADKTLEESELRKRTGVTIAACTYPNGEMVLSPSRDTVIKPGTSLIVIGTETAIEKLGDVLDLQE